MTENLIEKKFVYVKPSEIVAFRKRQYELGFIERLADSIKRFGLLNDPILRFDEATKMFQAVSGQARVEAAIINGLPKLRCVLMDLNAIEASYLWASENKERLELNPIDEADLYYDLTQKGETQQKIIETLNIDKGQPYISQTIKLRDLTEVVKGLLRDKKIGRSQAEKLATVQDTQKQEKLAMLAADQQLTVEQLNVYIDEPKTSETNELCSQHPFSMTLAQCNVQQFYNQIHKEFMDKREKHQCDECKTRNVCKKIAKEAEKQQDSEEAQKANPDSKSTTAVVQNDIKTNTDFDSPQVTPFVFEPDSPFCLRVGERARKMELEQKQSTQPDENNSATEGELDYYSNEKKSKLENESTTKPLTRREMEKSTDTSLPQDTNENTAIVLQQKDTNPPSNESKLTEDSKDTPKALEPKEATVQPETNAESTPDSASTSSPPSTQSPESTTKEINVKKSNFSSEVILLNYPESLEELPSSLENRDALKSARKNGQKLLFTGESKTLMIYAGEWLRKADYGNDWENLGRTFTADELNKNYKNGKKYTPRERLMAVLNKVRFIPNPLPFRTIIIEDAHRLNETVLEMLVPNLHTLCRIIFIAPSFEKVDKRIRECTKRIHFAKLEKNQIFQTTKMLAQKVGFNISDDDLNQITEDSHGSLKDAIHNLRVSYMIAKHGTE